MYTSFCVTDGFVNKLNYNAHLHQQHEKSNGRVCEVECHSIYDSKEVGFICLQTLMMA